MLKFLQNLFIRRPELKLRRTNRLVDEPIGVSSSDEGMIAGRHPLTITVHNANGGIILSIRRFNKKTDEYDFINYVVHSEDKISDTIEKILFIENLK